MSVGAADEVLARKFEPMFYTRRVEKRPWQQAQEDGEAARRAGEPRDAKPYLDRYGTWRGARTPEDFWLSGWDEEDNRLAVEAARPRLVGEVEWQPIKRTSERRRD